MRISLFAYIFSQFHKTHTVFYFWLWTLSSDSSIFYRGRRIVLSISLWYAMTWRPQCIHIHTANLIIFKFQRSFVHSFSIFSYNLLRALRDRVETKSIIVSANLLKSSQTARHCQWDTSIQPDILIVIRGDIYVVRYKQCWADPNPIEWSVVYIHTIGISGEIISALCWSLVKYISIISAFYV